eukprot:CAMPEP_0198667990 /NCGR_PEP_ID=MMETSP1467-20131203/70786_1 /TAXON_ID=1462469 /ORGANISM="unid. sp., Strain CCMP2135" /LENGTH=34 /DNA_ID= /DNA_START= /DNA_END= /DNA_ORIENTATION=
MATFREGEGGEGRGTSPEGGGGCPVEEAHEGVVS